MVISTAEAVKGFDVDGDGRISSVGAFAAIDSDGVGVISTGDALVSKDIDGDERDLIGGGFRFR